MTCKTKTISINPSKAYSFGDLKHPQGARVIRYSNGTFALEIGTYGARYRVDFSEGDFASFVYLVQDVMDDFTAEQYADSELGP